MTVTVNVYKASGKWYTSNVENLRRMHEDLPPGRLSDLIHHNCSTTHLYSGMSSGWPSGYYYTVEVNYPGDVPGFCHFHMNKVGE